MNRHQKFIEIANLIWLESRWFKIYQEEDWTYKYWKIFWKEILPNRSVNEFIFKPNFMKLLRDKLIELYWEEETKNLIELLVFTHSWDAEKFLYSLLFKN